MYTLYRKVEERGVISFYPVMIPDKEFILRKADKIKMWNDCLDYLTESKHSQTPHEITEHIMVNILKL